MFGSQAIRLLREAWGGILRPDAKGALREKGAQQLSEELYAMFDDDIPLTHNGGLTLNKAGDNLPLTINNNTGGPSVDVAGDFNLDGSFTVDGGDFTFTGGDVTLGGTGDVTVGGSDITIGGTGDVTVGGDGDLNVTVDGTTQTLEEYILSLASGEGGTDVFLGKVISGSGDTYQVELYGHGSAAAGTATVEATVPQIDAGETIPANTWVAAVHKFVDRSDPDHLVITYAFQPPVWIGEA